MTSWLNEYLRDKPKYYLTDDAKGIAANLRDALPMQTEDARGSFEILLYDCAQRRAMSHESKLILREDIRGAYNELQLYGLLEEFGVEREKP